MTALKNERVSNNIHFLYADENTANTTNLVPKADRATVAKLKASLLLPDNSIMDVEMDFDSHTGFHDNGLIVMNDYGMELLADAMAYRHGEEARKEVMEKWNNKEKDYHNRKPTYLFARKSRSKDTTIVFAECGGDKPDHKPPKMELED